MKKGLCSVGDAARELGVSPRRVRKMIQDGRLPAERVGGRWIIDRDSASAPEVSERRPGRPWSPQSAWVVLALASNEEPDVPASIRWHARRRLDECELVDLVPSLRSRAEKHEYFAHPSVLNDLREDEDVVPSGVSAVPSLVGGNEFEGYVSVSNLPRVIDEYGLLPEAERANVLLRVVQDEWWRLVNHKPPLESVVIVDLLESNDPRARRAGRELAAANAVSRS